MWVIPPSPLFLASLPVASALTGWALMLGATAWSLRTNSPEKETALMRWAWWALLAGVLVAFRWPLIALPHELYPDESQLLAGALTLRHDPVFWRSVEGGTAGPLDYYALLPAAFFTGTAAYAATRLTAALMIWGTLVAAGETLHLITNRTVARAVVLPALAFAALTTSPEFIHYSTELVPGLLLAWAVFMIVRQSLQSSRGNLCAVALILGAVPFAKLQAAPIAAALGGALVIHEFVAGRGRNVWLLLGGALLPTVLFSAMVTITGQVEHMLIPYFLQNTHYTEIGRLPLGEVVRQFWDQSVTNGHHALWLAGSTVYVVGAVIFARGTARRLRQQTLVAVGLLAVTIFCILTPGRPYHHYLNLLTLPLILLTGLALAGVLAARANPVLPLSVFLLCTLLPQLVLRASPRTDPFEYYNLTVSARGPAHHALVAAIQSHSAPGESLGLWGWRSSLYIEASLRQAARPAHTVFLWLAGPWQGYYLRTYYADMVAAMPPVFVDTAGPGNFWLDKRAMGHEIFPLLREWVSTHYRFLGEWDGVRLYVRLDRLPPSPPDEAPR